MDWNGYPGQGCFLDTNNLGSLDQLNHNQLEDKNMIKRTQARRPIPDYYMTHPERQEDEFFITNVSEDNSTGQNLSPRTSYFHKIGWKTKRMGKVAYDVNGCVIEGNRPVFVKQYEIRHAERSGCLKKK